LSRGGKSDSLYHKKKGNRQIGGRKEAAALVLDMQRKGKSVPILEGSSFSENGTKVGALGGALKKGG